MVRGQFAEFRHQLPVAAERELGVDPLLEGCQQDLLQPPTGDLGERLVLEIRERRPAPERQRIALGLKGLRRLPGRQGLTRLLRQPFEALQVELFRRDVNRVSGRARLDPCVLAEELPQLGDLTVHLRRCRDGWAPCIELVGKRVDRDDPVRIEQQDRERRALLRSAELNRPRRSDDLERTQDPELEHRRTVAGR